MTEKKGTGWLPDYPNIKDYTLDSDQIKNVVSRVQREQVTGSIEDLTGKILQVLEILAVERSGAETDNLKKLSEEIKNQVFGEFSFITAKIPKILEFNIPQIEVVILKIRIMLQKHYKKQIELKWPELGQGGAMAPILAVEKWTSISEVDDFTKEIIIDIQKRYQSEYELLEIDGKVDDITQEAIFQDWIKLRQWVEGYGMRLDQDWIEEEAFIEELLRTKKEKQEERVTSEIVKECLSKSGDVSFLSSRDSEQVAQIAEMYRNEVDKYIASWGYPNLYIEIPIPSPIPPQLFEFVKKKLDIFEQFSQERQPPDNDKLEKVNQLIYAIVEIIARKILPLCKHSNFEKVVEKEIENLRVVDWVKDDKLKYSDFDSFFGAWKNKINENKTIPANSGNKRRKQLLEIADIEEQNKAEYLQIPISSKLEEKIRNEKEGKEREATEKNEKKSRPNRKFFSKKTYLSLPDFVDLSLWCSPVEEQGTIHSCTAHVGIALTEYFEKKCFGKYVDASRLFLYKVARNLMHSKEDTGASLRETMRAMVLFGVPPEEYWPYEEGKVNEEPTPFCYSFAQSYQALKYFRLDHAAISKPTLLVQIKTFLVAGFPCMFGLTVYRSIYDKANSRKGYIPYPSKTDMLEGGHAVVAVGYDDSKVILNADGKNSEGALLIRNSWGTEWGEGGYGWLPYDYVLSGLTADWWSLLKSEWLETGEFGLGANNWISNVGAVEKDGQLNSDSGQPNSDSGQPNANGE